LLLLGLADRGKRLTVERLIVCVFFCTRPTKGLSCFRVCHGIERRKSTVVQLVERFYDVFQGAVLFQGKDVKDINTRSLRHQIGLVSQEPALFEGTIRENIGFGNPQATEERIIAAAQKANAHSFVLSLPDGYQTQVGDAGAQLSGGQKQRIAIARALVRNCSLVIL
jgi:ABC-type multidrug transport system fused ATPase/permease subunit